MRVKLACIAVISTVELQPNFAKYRVQHQIDWSRCVRVDYRSIRFGDFGDHMQARIVQVQEQVICTLIRKFNGHSWLDCCRRSIFAVEFILDNVLQHYRSK